MDYSAAVSRLKAWKNQSNISRDVTDTVLKEVVVAGKMDFFKLHAPHADELMNAAENALKIAMGLRAGERILIMSNPDENALEISHAVYNAALTLDALPVVLFQNSRTRLDFAEPSTLGAIATEPDVLFTVTRESLGNDPKGLKEPYRLGELAFNHIFYYLIASGKARGAWCPSADVDIFRRAVPIDYRQMWTQARRLKKIFDNAEYIHVTTPAGTDLHIGLSGREGMLDDGDYRFSGTGGNLPAGEVFAVPQTDSHGIAVIDGSMALVSGTVILKEPVQLTIKDGKIIAAEGPEAGYFKETLRIMRETTEKQVKDGTISPDQADIYRANCDNLAEFGIGLNPAAILSGNMIEDEKVLNTCHIAVGDDCYGIAPAVDHFDMIMKNPTFVFHLKDGRDVEVNPTNVSETEM